MNYLVTTQEGNLYAIDGSNKLKLLEYTTKSIYTGDNSLRFIKKFNDNYIIGASEELLIYKTTYKPEIIGRFNAPGLVDIKDVAIGENFVAILSGLRDSVYIFNKDLNQVHACFNIGKNGNLEFFRERQTQCQEVNSTYFQLFYCPAMANYHNLNRLELLNNDLYIMSYTGGYCFDLDLQNFNVKKLIAMPDNIQMLPFDGIKELMKDETITDWIEC